MSSADFPPDARQVLAPGGVAGTGTITVQVPDPGAWYLAAVAFRVVTDATVATRTPLVSIVDGSGVAIGGAAAGYGITASSTADYLFSAGLSEWDQSNNAAASGPIATLPLSPSDAIQITLGAGVAGDAISRCRVTFAPLALAR